MFGRGAVLEVQGAELCGFRKMAEEAGFDTDEPTVQVAVLQMFTAMHCSLQVASAVERLADELRRKRYER